MEPNQSAQHYELDDLDNAVLDLDPQRSTWPYSEAEQLLEAVDAAAERVDDMDPSYIGPGPSLEYAYHQQARYWARLTDIKFLLAENGVFPPSNGIK